MTIPDTEAPPLLPGSFLDRPGGLIFGVAAAVLWCALFWLTTHGGWERWAFTASGVPFFLRYRPLSHAYDVRITMRFDHEALLDGRSVQRDFGADIGGAVAKCSAWTDLRVLNVVVEPPATLGPQEDAEVDLGLLTGSVDFICTFTTAKDIAPSGATELAGRKVSELLDSVGGLRPFVMVPADHRWPVARNRLQKRGSCGG